MVLDGRKNGEVQNGLQQPLLSCDDEDHDVFYDFSDDESPSGFASPHGSSGDLASPRMSEMETSTSRHIAGAHSEIHAEGDSRQSHIGCDSREHNGSHGSGSSSQTAMQDVSSNGDLREHDSGQGGSASSSRTAVQDPNSSGGYLLHRAVFDGNVPLARDILGALPRSQWDELDPQGQSALHLAVLRGQLEAIEALLAMGFPPSLKNARGWSPLDEAIGRCSRAAVAILLQAENGIVKSQIKAKKHLLLQQMRDLPDYSFKLKWELGSAYFGLLLRKVAPHDTYEVWKKGTRIRVDGTLKGVEEKSTSMIPEWKRGHFSLLFDGATTPNTILLLDHVRGSYVDLGAEKQQNKPDIDSQVSFVMSEGTSKDKLKSSEFKFQPVKGWLGGETTEKIEGWTTRLYEATGKMKMVNIDKGAVNIPKDATYEEYLDLTFPEDVVSEQMLDPLSLSGPSPFSSSSSHKPPTEENSGKKGRLLTGRCWMAQDFPMSLSQLLPVLDIIGNANKHIARVGKFLQKYGDLELFPVKLQVPLLFTIYALISFSKFKPLEAGEAAYEPGFYELPPSYRLKTIDECRRGKGY